MEVKNKIYMIPFLFLAQLLKSQLSTCEHMPRIAL